MSAILTPIERITQLHQLADAREQLARDSATITQAHRDNANLSGRLTAAELERDRLGAELEEVRASHDLNQIASDALDELRADLAGATDSGKQWQLDAEKYQRENDGLRCEVMDLRASHDLNQIASAAMDALRAELARVTSEHEASASGYRGQIKQALLDNEKSRADGYREELEQVTEELARVTAQLTVANEFSASWVSARDENDALRAELARVTSEHEASASGYRGQIKQALLDNEKSRADGYREELEQALAERDAWHRACEILEADKDKEIAALRANTPTPRTDAAFKAWTPASILRDFITLELELQQTEARNASAQIEGESEIGRLVNMIESLRTDLAGATDSGKQWQLDAERYQREADGLREQLSGARGYTAMPSGSPYEQMQAEVDVQRGRVIGLQSDLARVAAERDAWRRAGEILEADKDKEIAALKQRVAELENWKNSANDGSLNAAMHTPATHPESLSERARRLGRARRQGGAA